MAENTFDNNIQSLKQLKAAYKAAMSDMATGSAGAAQRVEALRNQLDDLQDQTQSLRGSGVEKLSTSMGLMREAFTNADPGKLGIAMKGLGMAMKAIPIFLIIEGIKYLIENFDKLKNSSGLLGKVFSFIGDIVSALIQGFKDLTDWLGLTNNAIEDNAEVTIQAAKDAQAATTDRYDAEIKLARAAGKETLDLEVKKQQAIIDSAKIQFEAIKAVAAANGEVTEEQKKKVQELGKVIADAQLEIDVQKTAAKKKVEDDNKKLNDEALANYKKNKEEEKKADDARLADARKHYQEILDVRKGIDAEIAKEAAEALAKENAIEDAAAEKAVQDIKRNQEARRKLIYDENAKTYEGRLQNLKDAEARELNAEGVTDTEKLVAHQKFLTDKEALDKDQASKDKAARDAQNKEIIAGINSLASSISTVLTAVSDFNAAKAEADIKRNEDSLNTQLSALDVARDQELAKEGLTSDQKIAIENKYKMQKYALDLAEYNNNTAIKKKAFEQDKKMKIAQAVIATITGAISAVTGMISSIPGPVGIILGAIAGAAVTVAGVLQVAKIRNTQFDAGAPPTAPTLSVPATPNAGAVSSSAAAPDFSIFDKNKSTGNGGANNQNKQTSVTVKAVVVAQEITNVQTQNQYSNTMGAL